MSSKNVRMTSLHMVSNVIKHCIPLLCVLILSLAFCASAQTSPTITIPTGTKIKVKATQKWISGRVRIGDYIPFTVIEDVIVGQEVVIAKATLVYGRVADRKHRISIFQSGMFGVALDEVKAVDGTGIPTYISRPNKDQDCKDKINKHTPNPNNESGIVPCIRGRVYSGTFTDALPSAIIAGITTAALTFVKDPTAKALAAVTLAHEIATQKGFSTILNGADAEIDDGEIFDAVVKEATAIRLKLPAHVPSGN